MSEQQRKTDQSLQSLQPLLSLLSLLSQNNALHIQRPRFSLTTQSDVPDFGPFYSLDPDELEARAAKLDSKEGSFEFQDENRQAHADEMRQKHFIESQLKRKDELLSDFQYELEKETFPLIWWWAKTDERALHALTSKTEKYISHLIALAEGGNKNATIAVAKIVLLATKAITEISKKRVDDLKEQLRMNLHGQC